MSPAAGVQLFSRAMPRSRQFSAFTKERLNIIIHLHHIHTQSRHGTVYEQAVGECKPYIQIIMSRYYFLQILPKPCCSCAFLFSIIRSFFLSISFSLCFREISKCKNAHLSSTSLEISATAALTKTSIMDDNWLWKGTHVAMLFH